MKVKIRSVIIGLALLVGVQNTFALSSFRSRVPNGNLNSCDTCHDLAAGPPALNPFGTAFLGAGTSWTPALATVDSDGDGFTNGQELGDPAGTWTPGSPNPTGNITNPGDPTSHPTATAPAITTEPASQTVTVGANVTFTVAATGTAPLAYQWQKNTVNITGATNDTLALNAVTAGDAGSYVVVVSNGAGSVPSTAATLTVNPAAVAPAITTEPASQTVTVGANVTFTVAATGTAPLAYQWQKNTVNITGATNDTLALNAVTAGDAGSYVVVVSNAAGSVPSTAATLTVNPAAVAPAITTEPASQTVTVGANVTFTVAATGTAPLTYQWQKNTVNITGATNDTLTLNAVTAGDAGSYVVVVSNAAGSVPSTAATLTVNPAAVAPAITTEPASQTVTVGANVTFTVAATGTAPLTYQWQKNTVNITGATNDTLTLNAVTAGDAGSYVVVVSNAVGSVPSTAATLTINATPITLLVSRTDVNTTLISWDVSLAGFVLQENSDLNTTNWLAVTNTVVVANGTNQVSVTPLINNRFYRLFHP